MNKDIEFKINLKMQSLNAAIEFSKNAESKITNTEIIKIVADNFYEWALEEIKKINLTN